MDKKLNLEDYRKELKKRQLKEKIYLAVEIDQRKQNGERLADILASMKVLK